MDTLKATMVLSLLALTSLPVFAEEIIPIPNFRIVDSGLFRGAQPDMALLPELKRGGVRTIIDLRDEMPDVSSQEEQVAKKLGLNFIGMPINALQGPTPDQVNLFLKTTKDENMRPVYVHCLHGKDRTGAMVGLYRIDHTGWGFDQTYEEMKEMGYRPLFIEMTTDVYNYAKQMGRPPSKPLTTYLSADLNQTVDQLEGVMHADKATRMTRVKALMVQYDLNAETLMTVLDKTPFRKLEDSSSSNGSNSSPGFSLLRSLMNSQQLQKTVPVGHIDPTLYPAQEVSAPGQLR